MVDYAIMKDGQPAILVECKHWGESLDPHNSQLFRYFHTTSAKFGLLSNGIIYRFYTDLAQPNKMDEKPFFEFSVTDIKDNQVEELKKFHKSYFDVGSIQNTASDLKFMNELKALITVEFQVPTEGLVRHFAKQIYPGMLTTRVIETFSNLTKRSLQQYINDLITERLQAALKKEHEGTAAVAQQEVAEQPEDNKIETTAEELEGYQIVKAILRQKIKPGRVVHRDAQSYFAILLDDNNRKPICRLYLSGSKRYVGIFDEQKKETRIEKLTADDIFLHAESLVKTVEGYDKTITE
ncbi:MAG: type I restriction endonuclease [Chitinophagaceae bacterium]